MENVNEILEQFRNGSEAALSYYHKKHFAALFNFSLSIVKQDDIAKDIVSNSFFKLWKNRMKIDKPNNLTAYLYTSAKNECFTQLDKMKREIKHLEAYKHIIDQFDEVEVRETQRKSIMHERIVGEINKLPNRCRIIMEYTCYKRMGNQEIAKALNISVNTIKNQKTKGLKILRANLLELYEMLLKAKHKPSSLKRKANGQTSDTCQNQVEEGRSPR
jgi:RNA polymerase sigma-70 factor (family 1)